jgi:hypothetical protein
LRREAAFEIAIYLAPGESRRCFHVKRAQTGSRRPAKCIDHRAFDGLTPKPEQWWQAVLFRPDALRVKKPSTVRTRSQPADVASAACVTNYRTHFRQIGLKGRHGFS